MHSKQTQRGHWNSWREYVYKLKWIFIGNFFNSTHQFYIGILCKVYTPYKELHCSLVKSVFSTTSILDICIFRNTICQTPHRLQVISWLYILDILWLENYGAILHVLSSRTSVRLKPYECKNDKNDGEFQFYCIGMPVKFFFTFINLFLCMCYFLVVCTNSFKYYFLALDQTSFKPLVPKQPALSIFPSHPRPFWQHPARKALKM